MKRIFFPFIAIIISVFIYSCSENLEFNDQSQKYEGKIYVEISDNILDGDWADHEYKVLLQEKETKKTYTIQYTDDELKDYIQKSGESVRMEASLSEGLLKPISIESLERERITTRAPGTGEERGKGKGGAVSGSASILVVMVSDSTTTPNCSAADMEYQLIGPDNPQSSANLYAISSGGKFTIGSVEIAEATIPQISCSLYYLTRDVDPVLTSQGINIGSYDYIMYVTAPICSYGGVAYLNGNVFHNAYCTWPVVSPHELGHCLGMHHSTSVRADGSVSAYGDPSCVMATSFRELNAPHRLEMGWLKGKATKSVTSAGTYDLSPLELDNPGNKQVLIVDVDMINYNRPEKYYLSYRAPIGPFDNSMSQSVVNRLSIHTWTGDRSDVTRYIGAIGAGETYIDSQNGVTLTILGITNDVLTVDISFSPTT